MSEIKVLPSQVANQIAAGEVVERPAAVVKELLENAYDAGGDKILVEIEAAGSKRILIRDNGKGIKKEELALSLKRHATSKISNIEDLNKIMSMGFRGEALASIAAVSKLVLTSKPKDQDLAYAVKVEGLEQESVITPASHPNGTSVEVCDLFFNTPARRRFLRSEKTEFMQIEEMFRRLALSRNDVDLILKHNGKIIYNLKAVTDEKTEQRRLAQLMSNKFSQNSKKIDNTYGDLSLKGYVGLESENNPTQYFFVNNRIVKDKLINHAIKEAFQSEFGDKGNVSYVLFLACPPEDVDINVHPQKYEVRFQRCRDVHDFIQNTIVHCLRTYLQILPESFEETINPDLDHKYSSFTTLKAKNDVVSSFIRNSDNKASQKDECYGVGTKNKSIVSNDNDLLDMFLRNSGTTNNTDSSKVISTSTQETIFESLVNQEESSKDFNDSNTSNVDANQKVFNKEDNNNYSYRNLNDLEGTSDVESSSKISSNTNNHSLYSKMFPTRPSVSTIKAQLDFLGVDLEKDFSKSEELKENTLTKEKDCTPSLSSSMISSSISTLNEDTKNSITAEKKGATTDFEQDIFETDFLMSVQPSFSEKESNDTVEIELPWLKDSDGEGVYKHAQLYKGRFSLAFFGSKTYVIDLRKLASYLYKIEFDSVGLDLLVCPSNLHSSIKIKLNESEKEKTDCLENIGFVCKKTGDTLEIFSVPKVIRTKNISKVVTNILSKISESDGVKGMVMALEGVLFDDVCPLCFSNEMANRLLSKIDYPSFFEEKLPNAIKYVDIERVIEEAF